MSNFAKKAWGGGAVPTPMHIILHVYVHSQHVSSAKNYYNFIAPQQIFLPNENDYIAYKFLKILEISHKLNMI